MNDAVRDQYEAFPYPPRDPTDEKARLITGSPSHVLEINHYLYRGRRDFQEPFRVLIAGGGTGDATIMLGQQLAELGAIAEIVYLDLSEAAMRIAKGRAKARNLTGVRFVQGAIADIDGLGLGTFDYIDCCGVLHHLEDPAAGLKTLVAHLADNGGMGLMVYAPLGRTGVYHVQAMLRMLTPEAPMDEKLTTARRLLNGLPPTNWLKRNPFVGDHATLGDAGLFDLLLHPRDRAYAVMEVAELVREAGLRFVTFMDPLRYEPGIYVKDPELLKKLAQMSLLQRCAFAELLAGNMRKHIFYVVKQANAGTTVALLDSPDAVPVLRGMDGARAASEAKAGGTISVEYDGIKAGFQLPQLAPQFFAAIDGKRTFGEIQRKILAETNPAPTPDEFARQFHQFYLVMNGLSRLFLRIPGGRA